MVPAPTAESIDLSRQFFESHNSYGPFSLTHDKRMIVGCIEPRDLENIAAGEHPTIIQTGGGGVGEGVDAALAMSSIGDRRVSIEEGMDADRQQRTLTVFGAHFDCTFVKGLVAVTAEMAEPSDFTRDSFERWVRYLNERDALHANLGEIMVAAAVEAEHLERRGSLGHLIDHADSLYPDHANVGHPRGENTARVYVVNMHPHVGKNRNMKPNDPAEAAKILGYHESLAAAFNNLRADNRLSNDIRTRRATSLVLRAASTRTVISRDKLTEMIFYEVLPSNTNKSGLKIERQKVA